MSLTPLFRYHQIPADRRGRPARPRRARPRPRLRQGLDQARARDLWRHAAEGGRCGHGPGLCRDPEGRRGDAEIRAMLVASQRRWVAARDEALGDPDSWPEDADRDPETWHGKILAAMRDRTDALSQRDAKDPLQFPLIARFAQSGPEQRVRRPVHRRPVRRLRAPAASSSRPAPDPGRITIPASPPAATRTTTGSAAWTRTGRPLRRLRDPIGGRCRRRQAEAVASCAVDGASDTTCPDITNPRNPEARWNLQPKGEAMAAPSPALARLDAEAATGGSRIWLYTCLTDTGYPDGRSVFRRSRKGARIPALSV